MRNSKTKAIALHFWEVNTEATAKGVGHLILRVSRLVGVEHGNGV
jgi:hypothetical protein